jgi:hypothetical protein
VPKRAGPAAPACSFPLTMRRKVVTANGIRGTSRVFGVANWWPLLGVHDLIVALGRDARLVARNDQAQDVRSVVAEVRQRWPGLA